MTQNIKYMLLATLLLSASMISCETNELPIIGLADDEIIVEGDTVKITENSEIELAVSRHLFKNLVISYTDTVVTYKAPRISAKQKYLQELDQLKLNKNTSGSLKMVAIGGCLTAGCRDFGYFNEGIITSYPNLVARQMGIDKFELPLFDNNEYNGVGRMIPTDINFSGGPVQKFAAVKNNDAIKGFNERLQPLLNPYKGDPDNLGMPYTMRITQVNKYPPRNTVQGRLISENDGSLYNKLKKKEFDIFILESGYDDFIGWLTKEIDSDLSFRNEYLFQEFKDNNEPYDYIRNGEYLLLKEFIENRKLSGILLNLPDFTKFPFLIDGATVFQNPEYTFPSSGLQRNLDYAYLLPTSQIDSLLSRKVSYPLKPGVNKHSPLKRQSFLLNSYEIDFFNNAFKNFNEMLQAMHKKYNIPIVDIASIYEGVLSKEGLRTEIGIVDRKQFFSNDQMYPSPLGQAMIANEVIKTINANYKTDIPMIDLREMID